MKWPWVSRAFLDEVVAMYRGQFQRLEEDRDEWKRVALVQVDRIATMRQDGFRLVAPAKVGAPPPAPEVEGLARAEMAARFRHFSDRLSADLRAKHPSYSASQISKEVQKLWDATVAQDIPG